MSNREKILDDLARFAGGTVEFITNAKDQASDSVKSRIDELAHSLDLVPREDFEHLEAMVIKLREEQESLKKEIKSLKATNPKKKTASKTKSKTPKSKTAKKKKT